ncbi:MAG: ATP-binding protein [bacterium]|nr:ATP-binding protein [bacterium]
MSFKTKRYFNTSGPNLPDKHYTLNRVPLIKKGIELVINERYFTIWAPRQTGKSTYLRLLAEELKPLGYLVLQTNLENFKSATEEILLSFLANEFKRQLNIHLHSRNIPSFYDELLEITDRKIVLIIDEIEGLNEGVFGQFLHTVRNLYHFRDTHSIKSVILVGVSNIVGVVQDNASPFNIADNLNVPYFTTDETADLLHMHEKETGQLFHKSVKDKISAVTVNQPGLVNGFAYQLVDRCPGDKIIDYDRFLDVEDWFLTEAIDKNISNIINKAKQHRRFVEKLLFTGEKEKFKINDEKIKFLHSHGLIRKDQKGYVEFWVPIYKKALYDAFYPFSNGESRLFFRNVDLQSFFYENGRLKFDGLINNYKGYVKRRSFKYFREKDKESGQFKSIKEAAMAYSFETYIQAIVQAAEGKSYLEPHTGLGRTDLIVNIRDHEYVIEFKIFRDNWQFKKGKSQLAYYAKSIAVKEAIYLVFVPNSVTLPAIKDQVESIDDIEIRTYIVFYDEEKDF